MHATKNDELMTIIEILSQLKLFASIDKILQDYFRLSTSLMIPQPLALELLSRIRSLASKCLQEPNSIGSLANDILISSKRRIPLSPHMDMLGFCDLFQYRLETIGFMYICTAGTCLHRLTQGEHSKNEFAQRMLHYSQKALQLVRSIAVEVTDITIWLSYHELQTRTLLDGDLAPPTLARLDNVVKLSKSINLHQAPENIPFFLKQSRCFMFGSIFRTDKALASFLGQAPLLPGDICSASPPLDLNDEEVLKGDLSGLRSDGWNLQIRFENATIVRLRHMISVSQDDVLRNMHNKDSLRLILQRHQKAWNDIPEHLKTTTYWDKLKSDTMFVLYKASLISSEVELQIHKLLESPLADILPLCKKILDIVLKMTIERTRTSALAMHLPAIFLHTIAPVKILATALRDTPFDVPGGLGLIRDLSVFAHELEINCGSGRLNNSYCVELLQWLPTLITDVLDNLILIPSDNTANDTTLDGDLSFPGMVSDSWFGMPTPTDPLWDSFIEM